MQRRYDLRRSDNYMYTGRVTHACYGTGSLRVDTYFPVTSATVSWATLPILAEHVSSSEIEEWSSSSYSSSSSSTEIRSTSSNSSSSTEIGTSSSSSVNLSSSSSSNDYPLGLLVSGTLSDPTATGTYLPSGTYNGHRAYTNGTYWLWWITAGASFWVIGPDKGDIASPRWYKQVTAPNLDPLGSYNVAGGTTGTATVTDLAEFSSSSSSSLSSLSSASSSSNSSSSSSKVIEGLPSLYVSGYYATGFIVTYENISTEIGYIDFNFSAV